MGFLIKVIREIVLYLLCIFAYFNYFCHDCIKVSSPCFLFSNYTNISVCVFWDQLQIIYPHHTSNLRGPFIKHFLVTQIVPHIDIKITRKLNNIMKTIHLLTPSYKPLAGYTHPQRKKCRTS